MSKHSVLRYGIQRATCTSVPACPQSQALVMRPLQRFTGNALMPFKLLFLWLWRHSVVQVVITAVQHSLCDFKITSRLFHLTYLCSDYGDIIIDLFLMLNKRIYSQPEFLLLATKWFNWSIFGSSVCTRAVDDTCQGRAFIFHFIVLFLWTQTVTASPLFSCFSSLSAV